MAKFNKKIRSSWKLARDKEKDLFENKTQIQQWMQDRPYASAMSTIFDLDFKRIKRFSFGDKLQKHAVNFLSNKTYPQLQFG